MSQPDPAPGRLPASLIDRCVLEIFILKLETLHAENGIDRQVYEGQATAAADHLRHLAMIYGVVERGSHVLVGADFFVTVHCAAPNRMEIGHLLRKETTL